MKTFYLLDLDACPVEEWSREKFKVDGQDAASVVRGYAINSMEHADGAIARVAVAEREDGSDARVFKIKLEIRSHYRVVESKDIDIPQAQEGGG